MFDINMLDVADEKLTGNSSFQSNQLKTKDESFKNIRKQWKTFLEKELEKAKSEAISAEYSFKSEDETKESAEAISSVAARIAMLEAEIKNYTGEKVTMEMISNRAIKLRQNMYESFITNSRGLQVIPEEKKEEIFDSIEEENINSSFPGDITGETFISDDAIDVGQVADSNQEQISDDVNAAMNDETLVDDSIEPEAITEVASESNESIDEKGLISDDDVAEEIGNALSNLDVEDKEDTPNKRFDYEAMSDPQIAESVDKIGPYVQFENQFRPAAPEVEIEESTYPEVEVEETNSPEIEIDEPIREIPIVAEDRDKIGEESNLGLGEVEENVSFDFSDATAKDINDIINKDGVTIGDLKAARDELAALKEELSNKEKQEQAAKLAADEAEEKKWAISRDAEEVEGKRIESDTNVKEMFQKAMKQLNDRKDAVEKNEKYQKAREQAAKDDIIAYENSIKENEARIRENEAMQEELSDIIGIKTVNVGSVRR